MNPISQFAAFLALAAAQSCRDTAEIAKSISGFKPGAGMFLDECGQYGRVACEYISREQEMLSDYEYLLA